MSWHFRFFFEISAFEFFYLSSLLECCLGVLVESRGHRIILLLFASHFISKNPKNIYLSSCIAFCTLHCTCTRFALEVLVRTSYRKICIHHLKKNCAFHVVAYLVFMDTMHVHLLLRCALLLHVAS